MTFAWLLERVSAEDWESEFKPIFEATPVDREVAKASREALKPKDESGMGSFSLPRVKKNSSDSTAVVLDGKKSMAHPPAAPVRIGLDASGGVDVSITPEP